MGEQRYVIILSVIAITWMGLFLLCITTIGKYYIQHIILSETKDSPSSDTMIPEPVSSGIWDEYLSRNRFRDYPSQYSISSTYQDHFSYFYDPDTTENEERAFDFRHVTWMDEYESVKKLVQQNKPLYEYGVIVRNRDQDRVVTELWEK